MQFENNIGFEKKDSTKSDMLTMVKKIVAGSGIILVVGICAFVFLFILMYNM